MTSATMTSACVRVLYAVCFAVVVTGCSAEPAVTSQSLEKTTPAQDAAATSSGSVGINYPSCESRFRSLNANFVGAGVPIIGMNICVMINSPEALYYVATYTLAGLPSLSYEAQERQLAHSKELLERAVVAGHPKARDTLAAVENLLMILRDQEYQKSVLRRLGGERQDFLSESRASCERMRENLAEQRRLSQQRGDYSRYNEAVSSAAPIWQSCYDVGVTIYE